MPFPAKPCRFNDKQYPTIKAAADANYVSRPTMGNYQRAGYTRFEDVQPIGRRANPCSWNGIEYASPAAAARVLGIPVTAMRWRLRQGYTCDEDMRRRRKAGANDERIQACRTAI